VDAYDEKELSMDLRSTVHENEKVSETIVGTTWRGMCSSFSGAWIRNRNILVFTLKPVTN
jgi:hypothetical protein